MRPYGFEQRTKRQKRWLRFERHFDRSKTRDHELKTLLKNGQGKPVSDNFVHGQKTLLNHPDGHRITSWTQMGSMDVQLFGVTDDRPVDGHLFAHDAEFDKGTELADHQQALLYGCRMTRCFDVNVATIATG